MLKAEHNLVRARLAARGGDQATASSFAAAVSGLRELSTPYRLAHGLLDHAEYLIRLGDADAAEAATAEARDIASRLRCQPLLDRTAALTPVNPGYRPSPTPAPCRVCQVFGVTDLVCSTSVRR